MLPEPVFLDTSFILAYKDFGEYMEIVNYNS